VKAACGRNMMKIGVLSTRAKIKLWDKITLLEPCPQQACTAWPCLLKPNLYKLKHVSGNSKKIIAYNYFGGKFTWLDHLYLHFPNRFNHLIDLFAGSMCVSLNYKGRVIRTANEINSDITNFFEVLRTREAELVRLLLLTPCSIQEYNAYIRFISPVKLTRFSGGI
jgi:hypothetical protein